MDGGHSATDHERGEAVPHGGGWRTGNEVRGEGHGVSIRVALDLEALVVMLVEGVAADVAHLYRRTRTGFRQLALSFVRSFISSFVPSLLLTLVYSLVC